MIIFSLSIILIVFLLTQSFSDEKQYLLNIKYMERQKLLMETQ